MAGAANPGRFIFYFVVTLLEQQSLVPTAIISISVGKKLALPPFEPEEHEILTLCRLYRLLRSPVTKDNQGSRPIVGSGGVSFGYLGEDEPCCGERALSLGHQPFFTEMAGQAIDVFREKRVSHLVTVSPHCFDTFKHHYAINQSSDGGVQVQHYSQYLCQLVEEGRLKFLTEPSIND